MSNGLWKLGFLIDCIYRRRKKPQFGMDWISVLKTKQKSSENWWELNPKTLHLMNPRERPVHPKQRPMYLWLTNKKKSFKISTNSTVMQDQLLMLIEELDSDLDLDYIWMIIICRVSIKSEKWCQTQEVKVVLSRFFFFFTVKNREWIRDVSSCGVNDRWESESQVMDCKLCQTRLEVEWRDPIFKEVSTYLLYP